MQRFYLSAIGIAVTCASLMAAEEVKTEIRLLPKFTSVESAITSGFEREAVPYGHVNTVHLGVKHEGEYSQPDEFYYSLASYAGLGWVDHKIAYYGQQASLKRIELDGALYARGGYAWRFFDALNVTPYAKLGYGVAFPEAQLLRCHIQTIAAGVGLKASYDIREDISVGVDFSIGHGLIGHCKTLAVQKTLKTDDFDYSYAAYLPVTFKPKGTGSASFVLSPSYAGNDIREKGNFGLRLSTVYAY